jgi:hypothetical protein
MDDPGLGFEKAAYYSELDNRVPYITGSFTGWRYKKMMPLHEFTKSIDKSYVDAMQIGKDRGDIRSSVETEKDFNEYE